MCKKCPTVEAAERHAQQSRDNAQLVRDRNKVAVVEAYGGKCSCCGEAEPVFLCVDHVDGDGARHREAIGQGVRRIGSGSVMYAWLVKNGFPEGFQLLCANCNLGKQSIYGCPHLR